MATLPPPVILDEEPRTDPKLTPNSIDHRTECVFRPTESTPDIFDIDVGPCDPVDLKSDSRAAPEPYVHRPAVETTVPDDPREKCSKCATTDQLQRCRTCEFAWYCSEAHQRDDWLLHRQICASPEERAKIFRDVAIEVCPTAIVGSDRRPYIDVKIGGRAIKALLDTGSSVTCIREVDERDWVYGLGAKVRPTNRQTATVADGSLLVIHAVITLPLEIATELRPVEVRVIPQLKYDMILGMDAIHTFGICYDGSTDNWCIRPTDEIYDWESKSFVGKQEIAAIMEITPISSLH